MGNWNAHVAAAPQVDWMAFSAAFIRGMGLTPNLATTQVQPYDNWLEYFDSLRLANSILLDLAQDVWRYISDDYIRSNVVAGEVGSSTMPQKVNPIDFENAEGTWGSRTRSGSITRRNCRSRASNAISPIPRCAGRLA